jgi:hypothetical protein
VLYATWKDERQTNLPKISVRFNTERTVKILVTNPEGGAMTGATASLLVYDDDDVLVATLAGTVTIEGNKAYITRLIKFKTSSGDVTAVGDYNIILSVTLSTEVGRWKIPLDVLDNV